MKPFLLALAMLVVFGGLFAPEASARSCHRRVVYYERPSYGYCAPYYRRAYYQPAYYRPAYYRANYCRPHYSRPRFAIFF